MQLEERRKRMAQAGAAAPAESAPPPGSSIGAFNEGVLNELLASGQGASPITQSMTGEQRYRPVGTLIPLESEMGPANTVIQTPDGFMDFNPEQHVVFSEGGRMNVYRRNEEMEEGRLSRLARLLGINLAPARGAAFTAAPSRLQGGVEALEASGVTPTLPLASPGTGPARAAQITRAVPFAGSPIDRGMARARAEVEEAAGAVTDQYGRGRGAEMAGENLREAGREWLKAWRAEGAKKDKELADAFQAAGVDQVQLDNFAAALDSPFEEFDNPRLAEIFSNDWLEGWRKTLQESNGAVSLNDLRGIRRRLGRMLDQPMIVADQDRAQVQALYGAIAEDLNAAARQGGGDALVEQVAERNAYWADGFDRIERSMKNVLNEQVNAESIFERVISSAKGKGARANVRFLRALRNSVGDEAWNELASSVLVRMGTAPGAAQGADTAFSPATFLTNFNNMSTEARNLLFSGNEQAARNLRNLTDSVLPALRRAERFENVSQSGNIAVGAGIGGLGASSAVTGDISQILTALATVGGANVLSRALMSPSFTRALARASTAAGDISSRAFNSAAFWQNQLPRFRAAVNANPELQAALDVVEQKAEAE